LLPGSDADGTADAGAAEAGPGDAAPDAPGPVQPTSSATVIASRATTRRKPLRFIAEHYARSAASVLAAAEACGDDVAMDRGYELMDAGDGRRLERLGAVVVDRPAPSATEPPRDPGAWTSAHLAFSRGRGWGGAPPVDPWTVELGGLTFELRATESGQVGLFPEQAPQWDWLADRVASDRQGDAGADAPFLNLFAYTGAATLALARAGGSVSHVDGSRPAVAWARRNASLSGLADRPVRWLVDDADAFVGREVRRGRRYRGVVLDPPSYGHGAGGRSWRLEERLAPLLSACVALTAGPPDLMLLTAHTQGFEAPRLRDELAAVLRRPTRDLDAGDLHLDARSGARLALGAFARWPAQRVDHDR
jgi:23S rRNA (cytosine1962-C5)-methyltransferase